MKYYVKEGIAFNGKYNAASKARNDVEYILKKENYKQLEVDTNYGAVYERWKKPKQYCTYIKNYFKWKRKIKYLKKGDIILVQFPLINITLFFDKIIKKIRKKGIFTIALIHDLDSFRVSPDSKSSLSVKRKKYEDKVVLKEFDKIISHNNKMTDKINQNFKINKDNIYNLEIFDYIIKNNNFKKREKELPIVIAGNLSSEKAKYIKKLKEIKNIKFNLYGKGLLDKDISKNINYMGAFLPEELPKNINGSFGLVWDGESVETCTGVYGEYLTINNPHKISLYIISRLPIIIWNNAALANFVEKEKIGFTVSNLNEINKKISKITNEEYNDMMQNIENIAIKLENGEYLKKIIEKIEEENKC